MSSILCGLAMVVVVVLAAFWAVSAYVMIARAFARQRSAAAKELFEVLETTLESVRGAESAEEKLLLKTAIQYLEEARYEIEEGTDCSRTLEYCRQHVRQLGRLIFVRKRLQARSELRAE